MQNVRCWVPVNFQAAADPAGVIAGFRFRPVTNHRHDGRLMRKCFILKTWRTTGWVPVVIVLGRHQASLL